MDEQKLPLYTIITTEMIRKIETKEWPVGSKIPSEKKLGELFQVSRITVRRALSELERKGYLVKKQGKGSFVKGKGGFELDIEFEDISFAISRMGMIPSIQLINSQLVIDPSIDDIRKEMDLDNYEYVYKIEQLFLGNKQPMYSQVTYLPFSRFPMIYYHELMDKQLIPFLAQKYNFRDIEFEKHYSAGNLKQADNFLEAQTGSSYTQLKIIGKESEKIVFLSTGKAINRLPAYLINKTGGNIMSTPNILLTRIDNRLVHGQVGVTWTKTLGANLILVANDEAATEPLQQKLMSTTAKSSGAGIRFFTLEKTSQIISKAADRQKIFIVVKTPKDVRSLVEAGVPIKEVNVGNMHFSPGKVEVTKKVYVDEQDKEDLMYLVNKGIDVYIQDVPGDRKVSIQF
ncbi:PTS galactosamine transporter subunit IIB [Vagococcus humatus]|uniref:GntR family transcriptional regulator n=1 Tax=Vagococcus humatus TaxID=1889241 RepID=A0A3R9YE10_9ENTE|nr:PTS galactosamine transporter subunit IIB [Vagococcus humatus]RST89087.1 GntR family transcriptional regulator [Vagococcus humatus]